MTSWMKQHTQLVTPTDDPELLEQFDGSLGDAEAPASQVYAPASRSLQEARELLSSIKSARGYFLLLASVPLTAWLIHPLIASLQSLVANAIRARGKRDPLPKKGGKSPNLGIPGIMPKPQTSRSESRPPMSKKRPTETGATRGGAHHAPRLRPDQCMLHRQVGHRASECPNKEKAIAFSLCKTGIGYPCSGLCRVPCSVLWCSC